MHYGTLIFLGLPFTITGTNSYYSVDERGEPSLLKWNIFSRSSYFPGSPEDYEKFAAALRAFYKVIYRISFKWKSQPGKQIGYDKKLH